MARGHVKTNTENSLLRHRASMIFLLNTVSYHVMMLPQMLEEEQKFLNSKEFLEMKARDMKNRLMDVIFQTMRSGHILPMFAPHHMIQPPKQVKDAEV